MAQNIWPFPRNNPLTDAQLASLPRFRQPGLVHPIGKGVVPRVRSQGTTGLCTIFAINTAVSTILAMIDRKRLLAQGQGQGWNVIELSVRQIRDYASAHHNGGYSFETILNYYHTVGVCFEAMYVFNPNVPRYLGEDTPLPPRYSGRVNPIPYPRVMLGLSYVHSRVFSEDPPIDDICDYIFEHGAAVAVINTTAEFKNFVGDGVYRHPQNPVFTGEHALAVIGFHKKYRFWVAVNS